MEKIQKNILLGTNLGVSNSTLAPFSDGQRTVLSDLSSKQSAFKGRCIAGVQGFRSEYIPTEVNINYQYNKMRIT